ncbi:MAG: hypothetical protein IKU36_08200 [Bacteroidales bacterium]|nr:hypothetical protein [Bacteroidales bacterium]
MVRFIFAAALFFVSSMSDVFAQSSYAQETVNDILHERLQKLETICGEWHGKLGNESIDVTFYMEDSSSAIGEMQMDAKVFFLHCFAEDMAKDDSYAVGGTDGYDYCIMQQSEGEVVSVLYLSLDNGTLKGIVAGDAGVSQVELSRMSGDVSGYQMSDDGSAGFEEDKWSTVAYLNTVEAYESYLADFPDGKYADQAKKLIQSIKDEEIRLRKEKEDLELWEKALAENTEEAYTGYLESPMEYKAYERSARGRRDALKAFQADQRGDYDAVLEALDKAEENITLTDDMLMLRMKNQELKSYDSYIKSESDLQAISRGIEFVNTYLKSEKRDEVSDRVAYLMASSPNYLAGTPAEVMLTYAKTEKTREYVIRECKKASRKRYKLPGHESNLGFNGGIGVAVSNPIGPVAPVYGGHMLFSIGDNRNFLNFELGARYGYWSFVNKEDAGDKFDFHHLRLVIAPKFNLIRQKKSSFYFYVAPEAAYGYPIDPHGTGYYEPNSLSFGGRVGIGLGHLDLSASYMTDYWPMTIDAFPGTYHPTMVGIALTVYFSGSGR